MMRRILLVIGILIAIAVWHLRLRFPFDDAFISFRYAAHVAKGYGLVWNIGGPHTEGFTNLLFVLLLAVARLFTPHLLAVSQAIGLIATIITGIALFSIVSNLRDTVTGVLAAALFWLTPLTWVNALSGMETSLFIALCMLALWFLSRERWLAAFSVAFLATLTRPEGGLLGFILLISALLPSWTRRDKPGSRSPITPFVLGFMIPLAIYAAWKLWYFGNLFPNSFYVKVSSPAAFPGLQYVRLFAESALVLLALTVALRRWNHSSLLAAILWTASLLLFYIFVLPLEGLYDRFLWPAFTMLCMTAAIGARDLASWRRLRPFPLFACIVLAMQVTLSLLMPRSKQALAAHEDIWDASLDPLVRELQMLPDLDSLHVAYGDAGYVVYGSGIHHLDLFGLNDTRLAHARTREERASILSSERPDILLLPVFPLDSCDAWVEDAYGLARRKEFQPVASTGAFPFRLVWVLNSQSPYYSRCEAALVNRIGVPGTEIDPPPAMCYSTR